MQTAKLKAIQGRLKRATSQGYYAELSTASDTRTRKDLIQQNSISKGNIVNLIQFIGGVGGG